MKQMVHLARTESPSASIFRQHQEFGIRRICPESRVTGKRGETEAMKTIRGDGHGEAMEILAAAERAAPELGNGEVRARILASPVNPPDLLYVRGHYAGVRAQLPACVLETSRGRKYSVDEIGGAITQAERAARRKRYSSFPGLRVRDYDASRGTRPAARS